MHECMSPWTRCVPFTALMRAISSDAAQDKEPIADNITQQARWCRALFIWTDCDREGEHIGAEVRTAALKGNDRLEVKRARFSNTERAYVKPNLLRPKD